jgi:signal transduction histidine kinase
MRLTPQSLKGQLIVLTIVALVLSQAIGFLVVTNYQSERSQREWLHGTITRIATIRDVIETTPPDQHEKILKSVNTWPLRFVVEPKPSAALQSAGAEDVVEEIGKVLKDVDGPVGVEIFTPLTEETQLELLFGDLWRDLKRTLFPKSSIIPKPPQRPAFAHISVPLKSGQWLNVVMMPRGLAPHATPMLAQLATMAAVSALGIIIVLGRLTRPLRNLSKAASALGRGDSSIRLDEKGPREIAETIRAFNDMQERLSRFVHDRTKMLAALGHDLRTPITSLRLRAEFIEDDEIREKILQTLEEMHEMAEATLSFAREESAQEETRLVDAGALIATVCTDLADTGLDVAFEECAENFTIHGRPVGLKRALRNVIENAVAYGNRARVSIEKGVGKISVVVDDDGPGIADGDMERVFKPFVRLEGSRNKDTGGVGLGLSIARSIVRSHGGDILLRNRPEGGLRVIVTLDAVHRESARPTAPDEDKLAA